MNTNKQSTCEPSLLENHSDSLDTQSAAETISSAAVIADSESPKENLIGEQGFEQNGVEQPIVEEVPANSESSGNESEHDVEMEKPYFLKGHKYMKDVIEIMNHDNKILCELYRRPPIVRDVQGTSKILEEEQGSEENDSADENIDSTIDTDEDSVA